MHPAVIRYDTVHSTNVTAWEMAQKGCGDGTVVLAGRQDNGRGRLTRSFESPPGGLYMSLVLRPALPAATCPLVTLAAGVACADAIRQCCEMDVALKWPNDLYISERKLGGILTEAAPCSSQEAGCPFLIVGIGINVNTRRKSFSPELQNRVTSLYVEGNKEYEIDMLLAAIVRELYALVPQLREDPEKVFSRWRRRDYLLGRKISWCNARAEVLSGYGAGLRPDGQYQIRTEDDTLHPILAGDIIVC